MIKFIRLTWTGHVVRMEGGRSAFRILTSKPTGKHRRKWEDNVRLDVK